MGPREEDNGVFLLGAVMVICAGIAFVPWLFEPTPAEASKATINVASQDVTGGPVRVIVPFAPNTIPSQR
jgi:hypothetical protein